MFSRLNRWVLTALIAVVLSVSMGVTAQDTAPQTGIRPDAPPYAVRGAYAVGTQDLTIEGETPLALTLWYPALNPDNAPQVVTYAFEVKLGMPVTATVTGQALSGAAFDLSAAPYPLVVLSPGFVHGRTAYAWLAEHLASHGFVVIAPEHAEMLQNFDPAASDFWRSAFTRPADISRVFAYVDEQSTEGGTLAGLVDAQTVAVMGHSYGGYTALAAAGASLDIPNFSARCAVATEAADPDGWLCGLYLPFLEDMLAFAGLDALPEGLWALPVDPRVDAIVPMAGDAYLFDQAGLAQISLPVMALSGTKDTGTPYLWGAAMTYEYVSSTTKVLVGFENAEHMIFSSNCETLPFFVEIGLYMGCADPVWDVSRVHDLSNHFITAFLRSQLLGDADAAAALAPDAVNFLGVAYQAQGF